MGQHRHFVAEAVETSLDWNNYLFGGALGVVVDLVSAGWTVLSAFLSLCLAVLTFGVNAVVAVVTLAPQVIILRFSFIFEYFFLRVFSRV